MTSVWGDFDKRLGEDQKAAIIELINTEEIAESKIIIQDDKEKGNNYLGEMTELNITGKNKLGEKISKHLFVKSAPTYKGIRERVPIRQFYCREVYAYNHVLPALKEVQNAHSLPKDQRFHFIECYKNSLKEWNEFIMMDNMVHQGFKMFSRKESLDIHHMRLVMRHIAYFHSLSFALKTHNPQLYEELSTDIERDQTYSDKYAFYINTTVRQCIPYIDDPLLQEKVKNFGTNFYDKVYKASHYKTCDPYNVMCHGDFWSNNIIFKYQEGLPSELRFVDWQMMKHCSPIVDLSHLMFCATEQSLRKEHYQELLNLYYSSLSLSLQRLNCDIALLYPRHVFDQQIKDISQYGFFLTITSLNFLMREGDDVFDMEGMVKQSEEEADFTFKNQKSIDDFKHRIKGVISDFITLALF